MSIAVGIVNQTATETLFTIVKDNCLSWCDGTLRFRKDDLCLVSFDMDGHLRIRLTIAEFSRTFERKTLLAFHE